MVFCVTCDYVLLVGTILFPSLSSLRFTICALLAVSLCTVIVDTYCLCIVPYSVLTYNMSTILFCCTVLSRLIALTLT